MKKITFGLLVGTCGFFDASLALNGKKDHLLPDSFTGKTDVYGESSIADVQRIMTDQLMEHLATQGKFGKIL